MIAQDRSAVTRNLEGRSIAKKTGKVEKIRRKDSIDRRKERQRRERGKKSGERERRKLIGVGKERIGTEIERKKSGDGADERE